MSNSTRAITPEATLSFPHLHAPQKAQKAGDKEKYGASLVFAPGSDLSGLKSAALEAAKAKFGETYKLPSGQTVPIVDAFKHNVLKWPFRTDAVAKGYEDGSTFINTRTDQKPGIVYAQAGENGKPKTMADADIREQMYPGAIVRASVTAFGYDSNGNKGVSFALNNLQKLRDGTRIDGRAAAENEFEADLSATPADISGLL